MDEIKSVEGIPISSTGNRVLVVEYDNTPDHDVDAMGMLYLYVHEKNFSPEAQQRGITQATTAAQ